MTKGIVSLITQLSLSLGTRLGYRVILPVVHNSTHLSVGGQGPNSTHLSVGGQGPKNETNIRSSCAAWI